MYYSSAVSQNNFIFYININVSGETLFYIFFFRVRVFFGFFKSSIIGYIMVILVILIGAMHINALLRSINRNNTFSIHDLEEASAFLFIFFAY